MDRVAEVLMSKTWAAATLSPPSSQATTIVSASAPLSQAIVIFKKHISSQRKFRFISELDRCSSERCFFYSGLGMDSCEYALHNLARSEFAWDKNEECHVICEIAYEIANIVAQRFQSGSTKDVIVSCTRCPPAIITFIHNTCRCPRWLFKPVRLAKYTSLR